MKKILPILMALVITTSAVSGQRLFINEFMASNSRTIQDAFGDYEDWVEIYNDEDVPVNLSGYYMTDDLGNLQKHKLQAVGNEMVIPAKGFLLLWPSSNVTKGSLHLGFGLSANGEAVALVNTDGTTILDSHVFGPAKIDLSVGRSSDGAGSWVFFPSPSPGTSNESSKGYTGFLPSPTFSHDGGFFTENIVLTLSTIEPGATIVYTLDGSEPELTNLNGKSYRYKNSYPRDPGDPFGTMLYDTMRSFLYEQPIILAERSTDTAVLANKSATISFTPYVPPANFFKGNTVRARVFKDGYLPSEIVTNSFFITPQGRSRYSLPVISISIPANYFFDYDQGIYTPGIDADNGRLRFPDKKIIKPYANFFRSGDTTEKWANFEYFPGNIQVLNQQVGIRIHGGNTRYDPIKTLRIYARSEYGKSTLDYRFFPNYNYNSFKRILLRNGGQEWNSSIIKDLANQQIAKGLNFEIQEGQPSTVFINGEFWGIHNIRERFDRHFFERKFGIKEGELDLLENNAIVDEGSNTDYLQLKSFIETKDLSLDNNYDFVKTRMDINNYIDYLAVQIYIANKDWPNANIRYFRKIVNFDSSLSGPQDGRWRWLLYDTDQASNNLVVNDTTLKRIITDKFLFLDELILNANFRSAFINRMADLMNSVFIPSNAKYKIDSIAQIIASSVTEHTGRWENQYSDLRWRGRIIRIKDFYDKRPLEQLNQLKNVFNIQANHNILINVSDTSAGYVSINSLDLKEGTPGIPKQPYPWVGTYFEGVPVTLIAQSKPGYRFVKWQGDTTSVSDTLILNLTSNTSVTAVYEIDGNVVQPELIHYWHFNNLPSGTLVEVMADSSIKGGAVITYPGTGAGYMDRVSGEGSELNAQYGQPAGNALRVRNPSNTRSMEVKIPSFGYKDLAINWASVRTSNGAQKQIVYYSTDEGNQQWKLLADTIEVTEAFQTFSFSLKDSLDAANNGNLAIRVVFAGSNASAGSGNDRFDNISIYGVPVPIIDTTPISIVHYWHFNNLPSGTLTDVYADSTNIESPVITYPGTGVGYMDRVNDEGTTLNTQYGQPAGRALRVRNPSDTRTLDIMIPTTGYRDIDLSWAAMRTSNGAQKALVFYSTIAGNSEWKLLSDSLDVNETFEVFNFRLSDSAEVENNPHLAFRFVFAGSNASAASGNNRFDNILVTGKKLFIVDSTFWTGAVDTDWYNAGNWTNGIPNSSSHVVVGADKPNYPVVDGMAVVIKSFRLNAGASLHLSEGIEFTVKGGECLLKGEIVLGSASKLNIEE
jgi:hypothetical protein